MRDSEENPGFRGVLSPWLDLAPNSMPLHSKNFTFESGFGVLSYSLTIDKTMVNVFEMSVNIRKAIGYLSPNEMKCRIVVIGKNYACTMTFDVDSKEISIKRGSLLFSSDSSKSSQLRLEVWLGLDNEVVPRVFNTSLELRTQQGRVFHKSEEILVDVGCSLGCSVCYIKNRNTCLSCDSGFYLLDKTCNPIEPTVKYFELLADGYSINRIATCSFVLIGIPFVSIFHYFIVRTYKGTESPYIFDKIIINIITMIVSLSICFMSLSDTPTSLAFQWVVQAYLMVQFSISIIALLIYLSLSKGLPFISIENRPWVSQFTFYSSVFIFGYCNLLYYATNTKILAKLGKQKEKNSKPRETNLSGNYQDKNKGVDSKKRHCRSFDEADFGVRSNIFGGGENQGERVIEKPEKAHPNSSNDLDLKTVHGENPKGGIGGLEVKEAKGSEDHRSTKSSSSKISQVLDSYTVLDFLEHCRWLNVCMKSIVFLACFIISIFWKTGSYMTSTPFEYLAILIVDVCLYLIPTSRIEESWSRCGYEEEAKKIIELANEKERIAKELKADCEERMSLERESKNERDDLYGLIIDSMVEKNNQAMADFSEGSDSMDSIQDEIEKNFREFQKGNVEEKDKNKIPLKFVIKELGTAFGGNLETLYKLKQPDAKEEFPSDDSDSYSEEMNQ